MYIIAILLISPQRVWVFISQIWIPFHLRMLCAQFGWNWPSGYVEEDCSMYFHYFVIISPWKRQVNTLKFSSLSCKNIRTNIFQTILEIGSSPASKKISKTYPKRSYSGVFLWNNEIFPHKIWIKLIVMSWVFFNFKGELTLCRMILDEHHLVLMRWGRKKKR